MPVKNGEGERKADAERKSSEGSEITSSGVVAKSGDALPGPRRRGRDSEPPSYRSLTPYQSRLDVEMDDTAVSKVRDPSVSLRLTAESNLATPPAPRPREQSPLTSLVIGAAWGALVVVVIMLVVRACTG